MREKPKKFFIFCNMLFYNLLQNLLSQIYYFIVSQKLVIKVDISCIIIIERKTLFLFITISKHIYYDFQTHLLRFHIKHLLYLSITTLFHHAGKAPRTRLFYKIK